VCCDDEFLACVEPALDLARYGSVMLVPDI
jgi:hypothetical protein